MPHSLAKHANEAIVGRITVTKIGTVEFMVFQEGLIPTLQVLRIQPVLDANGAATNQLDVSINDLSSLNAWRVTIV